VSHTKGPWKYSVNVGPTRGLIVEEDGTTILEVVNALHDSRFEANLRHIVKCVNEAPTERDDHGICKNSSAPYELEYSSYVNCFVAVPIDDTDDALTLCGETEADARDFAERTGVNLIN